MRKNNNEFQKKKNVILFIYDYTCQLCGLIDVNNHVHHMDKNNGNNCAYNLIPLCGDCHKLFHKSIKSIISIKSLGIIKQLDKLNSSF